MAGMKRFIILIVISASLPAKRSEFLNSLGADGKFHTKPDMFICLNFGFDPGEDISEEANLKAELDFEGINGNTDLAKAKQCMPVPSRMVDGVNERLAMLIKQQGKVPVQAH